MANEPALVCDLWGDFSFYRLGMDEFATVRTDSPSFGSGFLPLIPAKGAFQQYRHLPGDRNDSSSHSQDSAKGDQ